MKLATLTLVLISVLASASAQVLFKLGVSAPAIRAALAEAPLSINAMVSLARSPAVLGGLLAYALAILLWLGALAELELSVAYPFIGLGVALTTLMGVLAFGEPFTATKAFASVLILSGIGVLALSS